MIRFQALFSLLKPEFTNYNCESSSWHYVDQLLSIIKKIGLK